MMLQLTWVSEILQKRPQMLQSQTVICKCAGLLGCDRAGFTILTFTGQLDAPPHAAFPVVELDSVLSHVLLRGLCDLQEYLLPHHAALDAVRKGDGRVPVDDLRSQTNTHAGESLEAGLTCSAMWSAAGRYSNWQTCRAWCPGLCWWSLAAWRS